MTISEQCQISRLFTKSTASDQKILHEVETTNPLKKAEASKRVDELLIKHNMPFDKAYPLIEQDFNNIALRYKLDSASLFWIYMEWRKSR